MPGLQKTARSAVVQTVLAGSFTLLGVLLSKVSVIDIGGTALDKPTAKLQPRDAACFWHQNNPTGYRLLQRQADGGWIETQPNGMTYHHVEVGRVTRGPFHGMILRRTENPVGEPWPVELFVPDVGAGNVLLYRPDPKLGWEYAAIIEPSIAGCPRLAATR